MIRTTLAAIAAATILLAGCSAGPSPVGLKESCDALGVVLQDFGRVAPTAQRYAEFLPKVKAIQERGDATTKNALQPLVAAMDKGAQGDASVTLGAHLTATVGLMAQCATAGSTALAPASSAPSASPTPSPSGTPLPVDDFAAEIKELSRNCAGFTCDVSVRVAVGYVGDDEAGATAVVYQVLGASETIERTVALDSEGFATEEFDLRASKDDDLDVVVARGYRA